ncbi:MAG: TolC family protein [bacterium]|nr:TolC family protein [bacterium]
MVREATPAVPVGEMSGGLPAEPARLDWHVPDPTRAREIIDERMQEGMPKADRIYYASLRERIGLIARPQQRVLTLSDALRLAMLHSYSVRVASYNPAVETTRIVEAEAAFDATFFSNLIKNKQNIPVPTTLLGSDNDTLTLNWGITKLLPSGMQATTRIDLQRQSTNNTFQSLNPAWTSAWVVELRQPLLRGFGIDFNRSMIRLSRLDHRISEHAFRRQVITTLVNVERAYWDLIRARREVVISGRTLASFEMIYDYLWQRREFDAYKIQISETKARLEQTKAQFLQVLANVRNAEDRLINLMNLPYLDLADAIEIIPVDFPSQTPLVLDRLSEVQSALDHRPELHEAKLNVKRAKIGVGQAENQALPKFDLTFRYTVDGLGPGAHDAFSEVTKNDFHEYYISLEWELPIGNRLRRAQTRRARLLQSQSIAGLKQAFEDVILDVNLQVRNVQTSFDQIYPEFQSAEANEDQVDAIRARAESKSFVQLSQELNAIQALAASRRSLLKSLVDYTVAIIELERSKGTLPEFNNVILDDAGE